MPQTIIIHPIKPQRGLATLITLIALLVMAIAILALVRSSDTASLIAGNLAFRRDLTNQAQLALSQASAAFTTGALTTEAARESTLSAVPPATSPTINYSPTLLPPPTSNPSQGIPEVLLDDNSTAATSFTSTFGNTATGNDITDNGVTIRYVVDRLCTAAGPPSAATCVPGQQTSDKSGTANIQKAGGVFIPIYRITVRVSGPRNTQAFLQATLVD
ncbi:MAG: pilus assembly PilX family protein [Stenotrophobium sp.]